MGVAFSGETSLAALRLGVVNRGGVILAVSLLSLLLPPATVEAGAFLGAAPTNNPEGIPFESFALPIPFPLLCPCPAPEPLSGFAPGTSGVPAAPTFPCGLAANVPRRFPAGIASAAFGGAGRTLSAMTCPPPAREPPSPCIEGGGAATAGPLLLLGRPRPKAPAVCCSLTDNLGAGATTSLCP